MACGSVARSPAPFSRHRCVELLAALWPANQMAPCHFANHQPYRFTGPHSRSCGSKLSLNRRSEYWAVKGERIWALTAQGSLLALSGAHVRVHELASELRLRDQVKQLGLPDGFRLGEGEPHRIRLLGALGPLGECSGRHQRLGSAGDKAFPLESRWGLGTPSAVMMAPRESRGALGGGAGGGGSAARSSASR